MEIFHRTLTLFINFIQAFDIYTGTDLPSNHKRKIKLRKLLVTILGDVVHSAWLDWMLKNMMFSIYLWKTYRNRSLLYSVVAVITSKYHHHRACWRVFSAFMKTTSCISYITHWGRDKIDAISQTAFSNAFSSMKMFEIRFQFHWNLFLRVQLTIFQNWFR